MRRYIGWNEPAAMRMNAAATRIARMRIEETYHTHMSQAARPNRALLIIVAAHVACAIVFLAPSYVRPDSIAVFAYLRSAVFEGDFSFYNEWASASLVRNGLTLFS